MRHRRERPETRKLDTHRDNMSDTTTKECPLDAQIQFEVPAELATYDGHCTTTKPNRTCPFIKHGCTGCQFKTPFEGPTYFIGNTPKK